MRIFSVAFVKLIFDKAPHTLSGNGILSGAGDGLDGGSEKFLVGYHLQLEFSRANLFFPSL